MVSAWLIQLLATVHVLACLRSKSAPLKPKGAAPAAPRPIKGYLILDVEASRLLGMRLVAIRLEHRLSFA